MEELMSKKFFKITNKEENHNGFQYCDGLNILKEPFNETGSCVPGGFYFTDSDHILEFLEYGIYLREIELPFNDSEFKIVNDKEKWRANKIILGKKYKLNDPKTFEYLISLGADIRVSNDFAIRWASENGYLKVIKYLVSLGADIRVENDEAIILASLNGHLKVIKYLVSLGAENDEAIILASSNGHLEVVKYLVSIGADIRVENDCALRIASSNGHLEVVKYLISNGADIRAENDEAVMLASKNEHLEVVKYLASMGSNKS